MLRIQFTIKAIFALAVILTGCAQPLQNITCHKSDNVDKIPEKIALYPLLSTPLIEGGYYTRKGVYGFGFDEGTSLEKYGDNVVISPPAKSRLTVTEESKMMTATLSARMSALGFSLSELPVEVFQDGDDNYNSASEGGFSITVDLLNQLGKRNDLKAILLGDVFFRNERKHGITEKRITFAHLKIIDISSLNIMGQLLFPYDSEGVELNRATERIACQLANLAGLTDSGK